MYRLLNISQPIHSQQFTDVNALYRSTLYLYDRDRSSRERTKPEGKLTASFNKILPKSCMYRLLNISQLIHSQQFTDVKAEVWVSTQIHWRQFELKGGSFLFLEVVCSSATILDHYAGYFLVRYVLVQWRHRCLVKFGLVYSFASQWLDFSSV